MRSFFCALVFAFALNVSAQQAPQWGNLAKGPYSIGYKTIRLTDYTRSYFENGRPLQIYVWYPATTKPDEKQMSYSGYFGDVVYDWGNDPQQVERLKKTSIQDFKTGSLLPSFPGGLPDSTFQRILSTPIPVFRNATPAQGKFPVILHAHANGLLHQSIMMEYLASYGYVVMSISMYGSSPAFYGRGEDGNNALLNLTQDLALVLSEARQLDFADVDHAAMIGMMAQGGLSLQLRDLPLKALACLDCNWNEAAMKELPYYDLKKMRIPVMEVVNTDFAAQQYSFLDSLPYAERFIARYNVFAHADFYPFPKIARPAESKGFTNYEYLLVFTAKYLNSIFKEDEASKAFRKNPADNKEWPAGFLFVRKKEALAPMPTESEFLTWLRYGHMTKAHEAWKTFGKKLLSGPGNFFFTTLFLVRDKAPNADEAVKMYADAYPTDLKVPGLLSQVGYDCMDQRKFNQAISVFETFVKLSPYSPHAYNGLADAFLAKGEKTKAKEQAKKVLELLEKAAIPPQEKQALKENAEAILSRR